MRLACLLFGAFAAVAASGHAQEGPAQVELRAVADVSGAALTLGDVATVRGRDLAQVSQLVSLPLGPAPASDRRVTRIALERWAVMQLGSRGRGLSWGGATEVIVRPSRRELLEGSRTAHREPAPALVPRGAWVTVSLKAGAIELEGRGRVLEDAEIGQIVKVQPTGGAEPINARVLGAGRVEAQL